MAEETGTDGTEAAVARDETHAEKRRRLSRQKIPKVVDHAAEAAKPVAPPDDGPARRWLRQWMSSVLRGEVVPNLHRAEDGSVAVAQLVSLARSRAPSSGVRGEAITPELVATVVRLSGDAFRIHEDRVGPTSPPKASEKAKPTTFEDLPRLAKKAQQEAKSAARERMEANQARRKETQERLQAAHQQRMRRHSELAKSANQKAMADPTNARRIADPNDPTQLAQIVPPLRRLGRGSVT